MAPGYKLLILRKNRSMNNFGVNPSNFNPYNLSSYETPNQRFLREEQQKYNALAQQIDSNKAAKQKKKNNLIERGRLQDQQYEQSLSLPTMAPMGRRSSRKIRKVRKSSRRHRRR